MILRNPFHPSRLLTGAILLFPPHLLSAAIIASTDFESYTAGSNLASNATPLTGGNNAAARILDETTATPFGADNQFLSIETATTSITVNRAGINTLTTYHFDFFEPAGATGSLTFGIGRSDLNNNTTTGAYTAWSLNNGVIGAASNTSLASGTLPTVSTELHYHVFVLYNGSAGSENVTIPTGGTATIAAGQSALFFYNIGTGTYLDGGRYSHSQSVVPTSFKFRGFTNSTNTLYIDNFTQEDVLTLAIPEPSSLAVGALGLLGLSRRRRQLD